MEKKLLRPDAHANVNRPRLVEVEIGVRGGEVFPTLLLILGIALGLIGAARLAWNIAEEGLFYEHCSFCGFQGFFVLDKSMPYLVAFALFVIAAGVWTRRS